MSTRLRRKSIYICCVFVFGVGLTSTAIGKEQASVLSRVQTVEDRELGELIRVALENLPESKRLAELRYNTKEYKAQKEAAEMAKLETVRLVSEAYAAIKLLDSQIEQTEAKLQSPGLPESLARELILAKAELETQREIQLAQLRKTMHIIPKHALGTKPIKDLDGWIKLDVIGNQILVFNCSKPFDEYVYNMRDHFVKLGTVKEAMNYATDFMAKKEHLPMRVDISRNVDGIKLSEELQNKLIKAIMTLKLEMQAEVHLDEKIRTIPGAWSLYFEQGKIGTGYSSRNYRGKRIRELRGLIDPNDLDSDYFSARLIGRPGQLPQEIYIEYDEESKDLIPRAVETIEETVKQLGIEKFIEIIQKQKNPVESK